MNIFLSKFPNKLVPMVKHVIISLHVMMWGEICDVRKKNHDMKHNVIMWHKVWCETWHHLTSNIFGGIFWKFTRLAYNVDLAWFLCHQVFGDNGYMCANMHNFWRPNADFPFWNLFSFSIWEFKFHMNRSEITCHDQCQQIFKEEHYLCGKFQDVYDKEI